MTPTLPTRAISSKAAVLVRGLARLRRIRAEVPPGRAEPTIFKLSQDNRGWERIGVIRDFYRHARSAAGAGYPLPHLARLKCFVRATEARVAVGV